jgi:hypothetical protein
LAGKVGFLQLNRKLFQDRSTPNEWR